MTIKQFIRNAKPVNLFYIVQSFIRQKLSPLPDEEILAKVANHPRCFKQGECQRCGCSFHDVLASDKECADVLPGDTIAVLSPKGLDGDWVITKYTPEITYKDFVVLNRIKDEDSN